MPYIFRESDRNFETVQNYNFSTIFFCIFSYLTYPYVSNGKLFNLKLLKGYTSDTITLILQLANILVIRYR